MEIEGDAARTFTVPPPEPLIAELLKNADKEIRSGFVRKVYGILSVQLLVTVAIALPFGQMSDEQFVSNIWILIVSLVLLLGTMCTLLCCGERLRRFPTNYIFLAVMTVCLGVMIGFCTAVLPWQSVLLSAGITVAIFLSMTIYACTTKTDFTGNGPYLFGALSAMTCFGFALMIMGFLGVRIEWLVMLYDFLGVLLFTMYIVLDTQMIMGGDHKVQFSVDDYCLAALILYLDIMNLFVHLLRLLGARK